MKPLKQENLKELTEKVLNLVGKTSVEIGHRTDAQINEWQKAKELL